MEPKLDRASPGDIAAISAIERKPEYSELVGSWDHDRHAREMADPGTVYLVWRDDAAVTGFVILQGLGSPDLRTHLKRIAVARPGEGTGRALLQATVDWVFNETETNRLDLDVFVENERAQRAYRAVGFVEEGTLRDYHRAPDGGFRSMKMMSILRADWRALRR